MTLHFLAISSGWATFWVYLGQLAVLMGTLYCLIAERKLTKIHNNDLLARIDNQIADTRESLFLEQRAWIHVCDPTVAREGGASARFRLSATLKNTGKTPALNGRVNFEGRVCGIDYETGWFSEDLNHGPGASVFVLAPNAECFITEYLKISAADVDAITNGERFLFLLVRIRYETIGDACPRSVSFCARYSGETQDTSAYRKYNHAD